MITSACIGQVRYVNAPTHKTTITFKLGESDGITWITLIGRMNIIRDIRCNINGGNKSSVPG